METRQKSKPKNGNANGSALGFEATLWTAADKFRGKAKRRERRIAKCKLRTECRPRSPFGIRDSHFVLSGEGEIRKAIIEADPVDCMVALSGQLFDSA